MAKMGVAIVAVELKRTGFEGRYRGMTGRRAAIDGEEVGRSLEGATLMIYKRSVQQWLVLSDWGRSDGRVPSLQGVRGGRTAVRERGVLGKEPRIFLYPSVSDRAVMSRPGGQSRVRHQRGPSSTEAMGLQCLAVAH